MSAVLAQFNFEEAKIPPLPSPPPIAHFLLENPIPGVVLLILIAIVAFLVLNARGKVKPALLLAALLVTLAGVLFAVASVVQTDRETISARTRELVAVVAAVNRPGMEEILADGLVTRATRVPRDATKDQVIAIVESELGVKYQASSHEFLDLQAAMYGPRVGRTQARVRVSSDYGGIPSWWRIDWQLDDDGRWRASRIEALWIPGVPNPGG